MNTLKEEFLLVDDNYNRELRVKFIDNSKAQINFQDYIAEININRKNEKDSLTFPLTAKSLISLFDVLGKIIISDDDDVSEYSVNYKEAFHLYKKYLEDKLKGFDLLIEVALKNKNFAVAAGYQVGKNTMFEALEFLDNYFSAEIEKLTKPSHFIINQGDYDICLSNNRSAGGVYYCNRTLVLSHAQSTNPGSPWIQVTCQKELIRTFDDVLQKYIHNGNHTSSYDYEGTRYFIEWSTMEIEK